MTLSKKLNFGVVLLSAGLAAGAVAQDGQNKSTMPDAQVESNVLRALAGAPELSTQNIKTTTVYGVVTLSGSVTDEAARTRAENLAARAQGVKKVVDEMTLGPASSASNAANSNSSLVLQSDGTYAPELPDPPQEQTHTAPPPPQQRDTQADDTAPAAPRYPSSTTRAYPPRRPLYSTGAPYAQPPYAQSQGGQEPGRQVTIPPGSLLRVRINQGLSTHHAQPGEIFDGTVLTDVVADGAVAIPRGASVQGTVVTVEDAGALKGRGELSLQLTRLTLGGQNYTIVSDTWKRNGSDKTIHTVNSALGLGALGAVFGAVAGGGTGAAIGAGVGGAAGVAASAGSPDGKVIVPPEAVLTFHLAQAATVATVSEQEMARLSYAAGPNVAPMPLARRRYYPEPYYAPYPPYGPYGPYYPYPRY